ncbi:hypothetical protein CPB97_005848 [Podila verticillata]|nr:hypothetical protein CPB97_005848 [Podila verticillata]
MAPPFKLACFDFDWSLIETDSDRFVIEALSPILRQRLESSEMQWTDLQNECLKEFHEQGGSPQLIEDALSRIPMDPAMIQSCQRLRTNGWTLAIVSDANSVYIEGILEHYGIRGLFSHVVTNPAHWDREGRLHIRRLVPRDAPHECPIGVCSLNICKGQEIDKLFQIHGDHQESSTAATPLMLYVGDGQNDYCPALRLKKNDIYFVRRGRSLERYLSKGGHKIQEAIQGRIVFWDTPSDILDELHSVI